MYNVLQILPHITDYYYRAWNSSRPLTIFRPIFPIWPSKSNFLGHMYCTFPMEKPLIVYNNVPAFKEWPINFKLLFHSATIELNVQLKFTLRINVTKPAKTGHICTKYTCSENSTFLGLCLWYSCSVNFVCFLIDLWIRHKDFIVIVFVL